MSSWDDEEEDAPSPAVRGIPLKVKSQWEDEEEDDSNVKDSWDADDDDEARPAAAPATSPKPATAALPPKKKKGSLKEKILEKEKKKAELAARLAEEVIEESPEERKRREERSIRESDEQNAKDLFGVSDPLPVETSSFLDTMKPSTKEEFDKFNRLLVEKLSSFEKSIHFSYFVENLTRDLAVSLTVDDVKRIGSSLTILANEKQKASKPSAAKKKGGVAVKKSLPAKASSGIDTTNYDDEKHGGRYCGVFAGTKSKKQMMAAAHQQSPPFPLPRRIEYKSDRGTLRFIGRILTASTAEPGAVCNARLVCVETFPHSSAHKASTASEPFWLGIEWDDPSRGKHSGGHPKDPTLPPLFKVTVENSGSFLKVTPTTASKRLIECLNAEQLEKKTRSAKSPPATRKKTSTVDRVRFPRTFLAALRDKYEDALGEDESSVMEVGENGTVAIREVNFGTKTVDTVGWRKIARKLGKLETLREVSLAWMRVGWLNGLFLEDGEEEDPIVCGHDEDDGRIRATCPNIVDLNLGQNLLATWEEVANITRQLEHLETLRLNRNRFLGIGNRTKLEDAFLNLRTLALNVTMLQWTDVTELACYFPQVNELHLGHNDISTLDISNSSLEPCFPFLRVLNLEANRISSWVTVQNAVARSMPLLESLYINDNHIDEVNIPEPREPLVLFTNLRQLNMSANKISGWKSVHAFNHVPRLRELRLKDNPVLASSGSTGLAATDLLIARIGQVTFINGSAVTARTRLDAELYYLNYVVRLHPDLASETPSDKSLKSVELDHPRFPALVKLHGMPEAPAAGVAKTALKDRLVELCIVLAHSAEWNHECPCPAITRRKQVKKRVPTAMTIRALRALATRLMGVSQQTVRLYLGHVADGRLEEADEEMRDIAFYDLETGDELLVILS
ncbi:translation initiation factor eIF3 subunit-domain-containing protein [Zopfochytrium polystomum]|nr:translation initiation factor eIF3 subunit-domain-containing protein [Zopfochytrium polystomum]